MSKLFFSPLGLLYLCNGFLLTMRKDFLLIALLLCFGCSSGKGKDGSIKDTVFDRTVQIMFTPGGAQVSGDDNNTVKVEGNHVTVKNTSAQNVLYELSGAAQDGSLKLYSSAKQAIVLNGVELTNPKGAAINNQGRKKCFVVVNGNNTLTDGTTYSLPMERMRKQPFSVKASWCSAERVTLL